MNLHRGDKQIIKNYLRALAKPSAPTETRTRTVVMGTDMSDDATIVLEEVRADEDPAQRLAFWTNKDMSFPYDTDVHLAQETRVTVYTRMEV